MYTLSISMTAMQFYFNIFNSAKFHAALLGDRHLISCSHFPTGLNATQPSAICISVGHPGHVLRQNVAKFCFK